MAEKTNNEANETNGSESVVCPATLTRAELDKLRALTGETRPGTAARIALKMFLMEHAKGGAR